ncbi:MAG TPA: carbohydrate ABC transporter permease [Clostridiales bacterium]|nr:carbohydrate ABC transporter permease [Clostridiales bacterium]
MKQKSAFHIIRRILAYSISTLISLTCLFPLVWMFFASFKKRAEVLATPLRILPSEWQMGNFRVVIQNQQRPLLNAMFMTFLCAASAVILSLLINMMAAYVFARMEIYGKKLLWSYCIITMYVPGITILITSFLVVHRLQMLNTFWVLLIPGLASGYAIFFFRQFFLNLPISLEDAARIDGCSRFGIFWRIFVPMSTSPMVVQGAGVFLGYWNSFLWPSITITNNKALYQVMPVIRSMQTDYGAEYGRIMAATCLAVIPPILMFVIFQKYIVKGVYLSGLK